MALYLETMKKDIVGCETSDIFWYLLDPSLVITQGEMRHTHNVYEIPFKALIKFSDMEQL